MNRNDIFKGISGLHNRNQNTQTSINIHGDRKIKKKPSRLLLNQFLFANVIKI